MSLPDEKIVIADGALGIDAVNTDQIQTKVGACSLGTANTIYRFSDKATLTATLGTGPLVEATALSLDLAGGPVIAVKSATSTAASVGSTTAVRAASSTGTVTASGTPLDKYDFLITIVTGEASVAGGGGTFTYSKDGGKTKSQTIAIPTGGAYVIPGTGVTATFAGASTAFDAGDTFSFQATAPTMTSADLITAINALIADTSTGCRFVHIVGAPTTASASATIAAAVDTLMASAATAFRYFFAVLECADDTDANIKTAFASFVSSRTVVCAGFEDVISVLNGTFEKRNHAWATTADVIQRPISEDWGRFDTGPIKGIQKIYRDETTATTTLDDQRFCTRRTFPGVTGFYIANGNTMAQAGSDFSLVQFRQVMDKACTIARVRGLKFLNDTVRVNPAGVAAPLVAGAIDERDAHRIESYINKGLDDGITSKLDAVAVSVVVNRATDITSTRALPLKIRITANGYVKELDINIGFINPALIAA